MDITELSEQYGISQSYQKKSYVFNQGDNNQYLYVVLEGLLKAYYSDEQGKEYIKSFLFILSLKNPSPLTRLFLDFKI